MKKTGAALLLALALTGCGPSIYDTYQYGKEYDPRAHEYIIGVSDVLQINVYKSTDLSVQGASVRPDGVITLPLVGDVLVAGKPPSQVRDELKLRLAEFVKDATVNVTVTGFNSYRFTVSGNVNKPGVFTQKYYVTVSDAIALATGPSKFAGDQVIVYRPDAARHIREIPLSYKLITSGKRPDMDICVVPGDSVVVQ